MNKAPITAVEAIQLTEINKSNQAFPIGSHSHHIEEIYWLIREYASNGGYSIPISAGVKLNSLQFQDLLDKGFTVYPVYVDSPIELGRKILTRHEISWKSV